MSVPPSPSDIQRSGNTKLGHHPKATASVPSVAGRAATQRSLRHSVYSVLKFEGPRPPRKTIAGPYQFCLTRHQIAIIWRPGGPGRLLPFQSGPPGRRNRGPPTSRFRGPLQTPPRRLAEGGANCVWRPIGHACACANQGILPSFRPRSHQLNYH